MNHEDQIAEVHQLVDDIEAQFARLRRLVQDLAPFDAGQATRDKAEELGSTGRERNGTVIEGVFDGQNMVGPDGKHYTVPANYASKSKLVEGDIMKLTITDDGSFIYKQIGPVERARVTAELVSTDRGVYRALTPAGRSYRLLTASVTYYKGEVGDTVIMLVPEDEASTWAAVENIVPQGQAYDDVADWSENDEDVDDSDLPLGEEIVFAGE